MGNDWDCPDPPALSDVDPNEYDDTAVESTDSGDDDGYRRTEIGAFFEDGAWEEAFHIWRDRADLTDEEYRIICDLGLFDEFDFFWDDFADRVGYHAPGIAEDWKEREYHPDLASWGTVSAINAELTEFGQIVCEHLKEKYIDWEAAYEPPEDLPEF